MGYKIELSKEAKDFIIDKGYDQNFGARPLKRAIQKYLEDAMAEVIIKGDLKAHDIIKVLLNNEKQELDFKIESELIQTNNN